jgi:predicted transcriptional regulator
MAGNALGLTERDRALLMEISRFGVMSRDQLIRLRIFSSKTRANERLKRLTAAGYLTTRPQALPAGGPRLVYFPGPALETSRIVRRRFSESSELLLAHQLGLVDVRVAFQLHTAIERWLTERELSELAIGLIPDAYVEYAVSGLTYCAFVEYDRGTEPLGRIEQKVRAYLDLAFSGRFQRTFQRKFFRTLFITDSSKRLSSLSGAVAGLTTKVIRLAPLEAVSAHGPLAAIWRRPGESSLESLTGLAK